MRLPRLFPLLCAGAAALALLVSSAEARGSRGRSSRKGDSRTGRYRVIEGDRDDRDDKRKKERERKEEAKKRAEERKRKELEKKKEAQAKKEASRKKAKARPAPAKMAAKPSKKKPSAAKDDGAQSDAAAAQLYEKAEEQFEKGELMGGVELLRQCVADHEGTDAAKQAQARLDQLLGLEPYGPMILLGDAEELFSAQRYRRAFNKYNELLAKFPNGEQAAEAQKRLAEIREGDLLSKTAYTEEELEDARFWLLVGNIHDENHRADEAMTAWRKVAEDFPGCRYAKQAEEKLAPVPSS